MNGRMTVGTAMIEDSIDMDGSPTAIAVTEATAIETVVLEETMMHALVANGASVHRDMNKVEAVIGHVVMTIIIKKKNNT